MWSRIVTVILIFGFITFAHAADWSSCADELDRLRRAARDASDAAQQVESAKEELESNKDELENCINYPQMYDLMRDRCQSKRWDYDSALSNYKSQLSNLENELNTVESRIRSVQWSCDFQFAIASPTGTTKAPGEDPCSTYRNYKNRLPISTLVEICKKYMTEDECKKCLEAK
jgi:hypothetical protein